MRLIVLGPPNAPFWFRTGLEPETRFVPGALGPFLPRFRGRPIYAGMTDAAGRYEVDVTIPPFLSDGFLFFGQGGLIPVSGSNASTASGNEGQVPLRLRSGSGSAVVVLPAGF